MPMEIDRRAFLQLSLLLLAVPIQYYMVKLSSTTEENKLESLQSIWSFCRNAHLHLSKLWPLKACIEIISSLISFVKAQFQDSSENESPSEIVPDEGESPAVEVLKNKISWAQSGHFASSTEARYPRPSNVKFRIGQVVKHTRWGYRGVIVGWDTHTKAPASWIVDNHGDNKHWSNQPNYAIFIDIRDRTIPQLAYVPQDNVEVAPSSVRIMHPGMEDFFEAYDGAQYLPRPWLRTLYPMDA